MPATTTPSEHLSIGEVLATLHDEFPDITISKIRFLESQGLIDPERTPSGYRKFYSPDIDRLRWILHQQKENFLPLKVIKGRLEEAGPDELPDDLDEARPAPEKASGGKMSGGKASASKTGSKSPSTRTAAKPAGDKATTKPPASDKTPTARRSKAGTPKPKTDAAKPKARRRSHDAPTLALDDGVDDDLESSGDDGSLTRAQLAAASGLTDAQIGELEEFGLLEPARTGGDRILFDDEALAIAVLAAGFAKHGIEARHLRMYRSFAEREATLYGQVIQGVLRQRNPEARARAREDLIELAGLGRGLRSAFLRRAVDDLLTD